MLDVVRLVVAATILLVTQAIAQCTITALTNAFPANSVLAAATWDPDGSGPAPAQTVLAGDFGGVPVAIYDAATNQVTPLPSPGFSVYALAVLPGGDLVAGGYSLTGWTQVAGISRWNGTNWTSMASFPLGLSSQIRALVVLPNGDLVAGGAFLEINGVPAYSIARWDGGSWHAIGPIIYFAGFWPAGVRGLVSSLAVAPNGDLLVGGYFDVAGNIVAFSVVRWDGASWHALGAFPAVGVNGQVHTMVVLPNGDLMVGGAFTQAGGAPANFAARWDGTAWHELAGLNGAVPTMLALPNGDVAAGAFLVQPVPEGVARWNGSAWSPLASGTLGIAGALVALPNGDVLASYATPSVLVLRTSCAATVSGYGAGCAGSGGLADLRADNLPWTGGTFRTTATGMPSLGLVLSVYGFAQLSLPMSSVLSQGLPGCTIHMTADFIDVLVPSGGAVHGQLSLPNDPAIAGALFHHYVVPFELDPAFQLVAVTSSNALSLTVGAW